MCTAHPFVITSLLVIGSVMGSVGCDNFQALTGNLNGKADATQLFWAKLQGIQWQGNRDITSLHDGNLTTVRKYDVDGVANGFSKLSEKHSQLATQLMALDADNVDVLANKYRDRLVAAHNSLYEELKVVASLTNERDTSTLNERKTKLQSLLNAYAQLCQEKNSIISQLNSRYGLEFDVAE